VLYHVLNKVENLLLKFDRFAWSEVLLTVQHNKKTHWICLNTEKPPECDVFADGWMMILSECLSICERMDDGKSTCSQTLYTCVFHIIFNKRLYIFLILVFNSPLFLILFHFVLF
jgi:hypothetical protein